MHRAERLARALAAACLATGVALAVHLAGGGAVPTAWGIAVPLGLAMVVSVQVAGRPMSRWRLGVAVTASQALFHALFSLGSGEVTFAADPGLHAAHGAGLEVSSHAAHADASMTAAHLVGAVITYLVLRRADVFVAAARRWADALLSRLTPRAARSRVATTPPRLGTPQPAPITAAWLRSPWTRGPPLGLV